MFPPSAAEPSPISLHWAACFMHRRAQWKAEAHRQGQKMYETMGCVLSLKLFCLANSTEQILIRGLKSTRSLCMVEKAKVKSCTRTDLQRSYALNLTPLGFIKIHAVIAKTTAPKRRNSPRSQSTPSLCKTRKTIPIWGSLEQIRIVSTVGFYLFKQGRWIDNHHMPFWGPITQLCVKLENLFPQSSNGCSGH